MNRLGAAHARRLDDVFRHKIALVDRRCADADRLVGHFDMQRTGVGIGIDGNGRDAHAPRGADDAAGDLAAIGDQDFLEHRCRLTS